MNDYYDRHTGERIDRPHTHSGQMTDIHGRPVQRPVYTGSSNPRRLLIKILIFAILLLCFMIYNAREYLFASEEFDDRKKFIEENTK